MIISNLNEYDNVPFKYILITTNRQKDLWHKLKYTVVKSNLVTKYVYALLTYLLTPWCRVLLEKLTGLQIVKKFPAFYGTRRFITALTSVHYLSLSWANPIQSTYPHPTSWRSILILSTNLRLGLHSGLFPSGFPTKTLYTPLSSPISATCPAHLILLDFITCTILGEEYRSLSSSLCSLLHSPFYLVPPRSKYSPQHQNMSMPKKLNFELVRQLKRKTNEMFC